MCFTVNGGWVPFVSEQCGHPVLSKPGQFTLLIPNTAPCLTVEVSCLTLDISRWQAAFMHHSFAVLQDGLQLHFITADHEYIFTCPFNPQFPYAPFTSFPDFRNNPQFPYIPNPVTPVPTTLPPPSPHTQTQEQIVQFPEYDIYPGFHYPHLPYPPGPQPAHHPQLTIDSPPWLQSPQQQQQQFIYLMAPDNLTDTPGDHPEYLTYLHPLVVQAPYPLESSSELDSSPNPIPKLDIDSPHYFSGAIYAYAPFYYQVVAQPPAPAASIEDTPPPATQPPEPPASLYHQYYLLIPYDSAPTTPVTQAHVHPTPFPPAPSPPEQPMVPKHPAISFYPAAPYNAYHFFFGIPTSHSTPSPPASTTAVSQEPQTPAPQQGACLPYTDNTCGYYPYPYYNPFYPPPYPVLPQYPQPYTTTPTTTTAVYTTNATSSTPTGPTTQIPQLQCMMGNMTAFLPFAHPGSIQVKG